MSYTNRRGVNVSQYLRNLNVQESAVEETFLTDDELAKDLALFTNTQFIDFETGQNTDYQAPPVKPETVSPAEDVTPTDPLLEDFSSNIDFMSGKLLRLFGGGGAFFFLFRFIFYCFPFEHLLSSHT